VDDYDAELAERYGWMSALPAKALGDFVRSLAHRIADTPASASGQRGVCHQLGPVETASRFRSLREGVRNPGQSASSRDRADFDSKA
jgi:hypothetical protein